MALSDIAARNAKAKEKPYKIADEKGLYLLIHPNGSKYWRMDYRFNGKRKTLALGVYPDVPLAGRMDANKYLEGARDLRDAAKRKLKEGIDPAAEKKAKARQQSASVSFEDVAREWYGKQATCWKPGHAVTVINRLESNVFPWLGSMPIGEIEPPEVLAVLRRIESRGAVETAHRVKSICGQVFRYAVATGQAKRDPVPDLKGALSPVQSVSMPTITSPKRVGELMRAIQGYEGTHVVRCALQIAPYVFVRPGELRHAEWAEVDLDKAEWRIPAEKMKMKRMHIVPLSHQVVAILRDLKPLTGRGKYLFPSVRTDTRPMSENTINAALRRIGFDKGEIVGHGFRAMASTILHEHGWKSDVIERQLAHIEGNKVKGAYNHAEHLPERKALMQQWADYLDALRDGAEVIPIRKA